MYKLTGVMFSQEEIEAKVIELAKQIEKDYKGQDLLLVGILKGASVFVADLMRKIDLNVNIDFMSVSSYGSGTVSSGTVKILKDLDVDVDYVGFVIEDKFIVGYGIDYDEKYRNLPYIAIVEDVED